MDAKGSSRPEKQAIVSELRACLAEAAFVLLLDYRGLKVRQGEELRRKLAKLGARLQIVKNDFLKLALSETRRAQVADALSTPTAIIVGGGDLVATAKVLAGFQQEQRVLAIQRGFWDGQVLSSTDLEALVKLPARPVLLSMLLGTMAAPMSRLAMVFNQKVASLVYVLKAVQEKKAGQDKPQPKSDG
ncbi:MAG: 50S ribosomal protein L10 [Lentisphaerae bacterium]|nr:50S ribosomal protein L10 [Lentisphaerota bacterium]